MSDMKKEPDMIRAREVDRARGLAGATTGGHKESPEMTALFNRYIYHEIDAKELAELGQELALKELDEAVARKKAEEAKKAAEATEQK